MSIQVAVGHGGWHRTEGDFGLPGAVYFRAQDVNGHLRLTELYIDGRGAPLSAAALRRLPLQALEEVAELDDAPGPDLSRLASHFASSFGKARHWVADSFRAQIRGSGVPQAPVPTHLRATTAPESPQLEAPPDGRLTDAFLHDVARAYRAAVARREPPANALAEMAGVSPRTVHRWVYTARQRGLMPPARSKGRIV